jgi:sugar phosphate isomerase/epimerase
LRISIRQRRFHIERARQYLELGYELEAKNYLIVIGEYIWQQEVIPPLDQWNWAVEGLRELGEYAASLGLEIAIELEPFHLSIVNDVPSMSRFLHDVGHPAVKANLDVSHLALVHAPAAEILSEGVSHRRIFPIAMEKARGPAAGPGASSIFCRTWRTWCRSSQARGIELEFAPNPDKIVDWVTGSVSRDG